MMRGSAFSGKNGGRVQKWDNARKMERKGAIGQREGGESRETTNLAGRNGTDLNHNHLTVAGYRFTGLAVVTRRHVDFGAKLSSCTFHIYLLPLGSHMFIFFASISLPGNLALLRQLIILFFLTLLYKKFQSSSF